MRDDVQLVTLPARRFFFENYSHRYLQNLVKCKKVGKKVDSEAGLHSKLTIMSMHVAHTE